MEMAQWVKAFPIKVHNPNPLNPQFRRKDSHYLSSNHTYATTQVAAQTQKYG